MPKGGYARRCNYGWLTSPGGQRVEIYPFRRTEDYRWENKDVESVSSVAIIILKIILIADSYLQIFACAILAKLLEPHSLSHNDDG